MGSACSRGGKVDDSSNIDSKQNAASPSHYRSPAPTVEDNQKPAPTVDDNQTPAPTVDDNQSPAPTVDDNQTPAPTVDDKQSPAPTVEDNEDPAPIVDDKQSAAPHAEENENPTTPGEQPDPASRGDGSASKAVATRLCVASWNMAGINNNPFEYWMDSLGDSHVSAAEAAYSKLMHDSEDFVTRQKNVAEADAVKVKDVMTPNMVEELFQLMEPKGWEGLDETREHYKSDLSERTIVNGVLFCDATGKKRLCSWPDRFCNSISCVDEDGSGKILYRPSVINLCVDKNLEDPKTRWEIWKNFMFTRLVRMEVGKDQVTVSDLLQPLSRLKYTALTDLEEKISMPLQTLYLAVFDMIMFRIVDEAMPGGKWFELKRQIVEARSNRIARIVEILRSKHYSQVDVICVCEASTAFKNAAEAALEKDYLIPKPELMDKARDQNSMMLLRKSLFDMEKLKDITAEVLPFLPTKSTTPTSDKKKKSAISTGDLFVLHAETDIGPFVLATFHGDTQGLSTIPMLTALSMLVEKRYSHCQLIIGMDANSYFDGKNGARLDVQDMGKWLADHGWQSCFGTTPSTAKVTTCTARTFLQPQMNKANMAASRATNGDVSPKDHIMFLNPDTHIRGCRLVGEARRDNTGSGHFKADVTFPTLMFPSDHAIICAVLELESKQSNQIGLLSLV